MFAGIIADVNMPRSPKTADAPRHSLLSVNIQNRRECELNENMGGGRGGINFSRMHESNAKQ